MLCATLIDTLQYHLTAAGILGSRSFDALSIADMTPWPALTDLCLTSLNASWSLCALSWVSVPPYSFFVLRNSLTSSAAVCFDDYVPCPCLPSAPAPPELPHMHRFSSRCPIHPIIHHSFP